MGDLVDVWAPGVCLSFWAESKQTQTRSGGSSGRLQGDTPVLGLQAPKSPIKLPAGSVRMPPLWPVFIWDATRSFRAPPSPSEPLRVVVFVSADQFLLPFLSAKSFLPRKLARAETPRPDWLTTLVHSAILFISDWQLRLSLNRPLDPSSIGL